MARVFVIPDARLDIKFIEDGLKLAKNNNAEIIILMGNMFDRQDGKKAGLESYKAMYNFLIETMRYTSGFFPLIGAAELNYMNLATKSKGYNKDFGSWVGNKIVNDYRFLPCKAVDGILFSNSGVTIDWIRRYKVMNENEIRFRLGHLGGAGLIENAILKQTKWSIFFNDSGTIASPFRINIIDLLEAAPDKITQVVGKTVVEHICNDGKIWMTNSENKNEYLFIVDGIPRIVERNELNGEKKWTGLSWSH